jgi:hypothetical protein
MEQDDPELVQTVKERYLDPPSTLPYNFQVFNFHATLIYNSFIKIIAIDRMLQSEYQTAPSREF